MVYDRGFHSLKLVLMSSSELLFWVRQWVHLFCVLCSFEVFECVRLKFLVSWIRVPKLELVYLDEVTADGGGIQIIFSNNIEGTSTENRRDEGHTP